MWLSSDQWDIKRSLLENFWETKRSAYGGWGAFLSIIFTSSLLGCWIKIKYPELRYQSCTSKGTNIKMKIQHSEYDHKEAGGSAWVLESKCHRATELIPLATYLHILYFVRETSPCRLKPQLLISCYLKPNSLLNDTMIKQKQPQLFFFQIKLPPWNITQPLKRIYLHQF